MTEKDLVALRNAIVVALSNVDVKRLKEEEFFGMNQSKLREFKLAA